MKAIFAVALGAAFFQLAPLVDAPRSQVSWRRSDTPTSEWSVRMTYDSARKRAVLLQPSNDGRNVLDVMEWDGQRWHRSQVPGSPSLRHLPAWCYDPVLGACVLFGGTEAGLPLSDTWLWDGRSWTEVRTPMSPSARYFAMTCFEPTIGRIVLFGGEGRLNQQTVLLGDLWSFDGKTWRLENGGGSNAPLPRTQHALFYDALVGELVLYGGYTGAFSTDTWSWRPSQGWRQLVVSGVPPNRIYHAVAFDTTRGVGLLVGNYGGWIDNETWEWNGVLRRWSLVGSIPPTNGGRSGSGVVWTGSEVLMCGGGMDYRNTAWGHRSDLFRWHTATKTWIELHPSLPDGWHWQFATDPVRKTLVAYRSDGIPTVLWERAGGVWKAFPPKSDFHPKDRWHPCVANDGRGAVIVFGGRRGTSTFLADAWSYDGKAWTALPTGPSGRSRVAAVGTPWNGGTAWFYGGRTNDSPVTTSDELWAYTTAWTKVVKTALWPPELEGAALAYDSDRDRVVLFGGTNAQGDTNRTWEWNGLRWSIVNPIASPPPMSLHRMSYDPRLKRCIAINGLGEAWTYDGTTWERLAVCEAPGRGYHFQAGLGYDPVAQETVLLSQAEWRLTILNAATFENYGIGCPAGANEALLHSSTRPVLGTSMAIEARWKDVLASVLLLGSSRTKLGNLDLPLPLVGITSAACWLQTSAELSLPATAVLPNKHALYQFPIPNDLSLNGACLFLQAVVLSTSEVAMTDAAALRVSRL